jgi:hypothetical protein
MLDLYHEFELLISALNERQIEYDLCGGLAMAVHGAPRTTVDIDCSSPPRTSRRSRLRRAGWVIAAGPMTFRNGAVESRRVSKPDPDSHDLLMLDLLLVTPEVSVAWQTRTEVEWERYGLSPSRA